LNLYTLFVNHGEQENKRTPSVPVVLEQGEEVKSESPKVLLAVDWLVVPKTTHQGSKIALERR
jgi:hypothetical protein